MIITRNIPSRFFLPAKGFESVPPKKPTLQQTFLQSRTVSALRNRRTKMIATIGPNQLAQDTLRIPKKFKNNPFEFLPYRALVTERLAQLSAQGIDCFRCNFSHGNWHSHLGVIECARTLPNQPEILVDLPGRKIRLQEFKEKAIEVTKGETILFDSRLKDLDAPTRSARQGKQIVLGLNHAQVFNDIEEALRGKRPNRTAPIYIAIGDGPDVKLRVIEVKRGQVVTEVVESGLLKQKKGTNFTNMNVSLPVAYPRDIEGIHLALHSGAEFIGLSFIQSVEEIQEIDAIVMRLLVQNPSWKKPKYVVKVETTALTAHFREYDDQARLLKNRYECFEKILQHPNVEIVMLARGDLALVLNREDLHQQVQAISDYCRAYGVEVILATGVFESLEREVRNVSRNDLTVVQSYYMLGNYDWVMFSGETAEGPNWKTVVEMMDDLLKSYERQYGYVPHFLPRIQQVEKVVDELRRHPACFLASVYNHFCRPLIVNAPKVAPDVADVYRLQTKQRRDFVKETFGRILKEDETLALDTLHHMNSRYAAALLSYFEPQDTARILERLTNQKIIQVYFDPQYGAVLSRHFKPRALRLDEEKEFVRCIYEQFRVSADAHSISRLLTDLNQHEIALLLDSIVTTNPADEEKVRVSARAIFVTLNEIWARQDTPRLHRFLENLVGALENKNALITKILSALSHEALPPKGSRPATRYSYLAGDHWAQELGKILTV